MQKAKVVVDLLIHSAAQLCTIADPGGPQRGQDLGDLAIIEDGALAVQDGRILAVGTSTDLRARFHAQQEMDASGRCVIPGFVDPHTHLPWAGERAAEFEIRVGGATYMQIMQAGGGIMATVGKTRRASLDQLVAENLPRLRTMLAHGTTTAECKTGYGLDTATELKQLDAILALDAAQPVDLVPTFMPAHAVPAEYRGRTEEFIDLIVDEILPAGAAWAHQHDIRLFCDVFCEEGVFDVAQSRRVLERAVDLGYGLKVHADEFVGIGGTGLAVEMGAISADHLVETPYADIMALGQGKTIAVGLPQTPFGLGQTKFTPAQAILEAGGALALATDINPGGAWGESMQMVMAIACRYMGLTPAQALVASTLNAAHAIGRGETVGSLSPGKQADFLILSADDYRHLGYRFGTNLVDVVVKRGGVVRG